MLNNSPISAKNFLILAELSPYFCQATYYCLLFLEANIPILAEPLSILAEQYYIISAEPLSILAEQYYIISAEHLSILAEQYCIISAEHLSILA